MGAIDRFDLRTAVLHRSPDVRNWPITIPIVGARCTPAGGFELAFGRPIPDTWKWPSNPAVPSDNFQYTVWFFVRIAGVWHGAGLVQMWQGRPMGTRELPPLFQDVDGAPGYTRLWGDIRRLWDEMSDYVPVQGEQLGLMITAGNARLTDSVTSVAERSQVVTFPISDAMQSVIYTEDVPKPGGPMADHRDVVASVKAQLEARGVDLSGPCGAFAITSRVAWALRDEGAGLLDKPGGNNCGGYATDYIVYRSGPSFDILGDGGGANTPQWNQDDDPTLLPRWRAPLPQSDDAPGPTDPGQPPAPIPPTAPAAVDLTPVLAKLQELADTLKTQEDTNKRRFDLLNAPKKAPIYDGTITLPYFGKFNIALTPRS